MRLTLPQYYLPVFKNSIAACTYSVDNGMPLGMQYVENKSENLFWDVVFRYYRTVRRRV